MRGISAPTRAIRPSRSSRCESEACFGVGGGRLGDGERVEDPLEGHPEHGGVGAEGIEQEASNGVDVQGSHLFEPEQALVGQHGEQSSTVLGADGALDETGFDEAIDADGSSASAPR